VQPIKTNASAEDLASETSDADARALVESVTWYHAFELRPGIVTPGSQAINPSAACDALGIPRDLNGKSALDVGAWDGALTFELERRGARSFALDIQDPKRVGFDIARRILRSNAVHYRGSVYQLPFDELRDLDVVVMRGVYYHLKYPLLGFECAAAALKLGGTLYFEGEGFSHYAETIDGRAVDFDVAKSELKNVPVCLAYPNSYKKASNWFIPSAAALAGWIAAAGMKVERMGCWTDGEAGQRLYGNATKIDETSFKLEHPLY